MCLLAPDARALRLAVLPELRRVVGFDAYAWLVTDPATAVGASPLADVPWLPELPGSDSPQVPYAAEPVDDSDRQYGRLA